MTKEILMKTIESYFSIYSEEKRYKEEILDFLRKNIIFQGKKNQEGHMTGSAWIISKDRKKVLLTHHAKLHKWVQLGGHTEEGESIFNTAKREALEESGLSSIRFLQENIFDIDVHLIPARKEEKAHYHYDIRFLFEADEADKIISNEETNEIRWVSIDEIRNYTKAKSILRMVEKSKKEVADSI